jgi:hypothetical protein
VIKAVFPRMAGMTPDRGKFVNFFHPSEEEDFALEDRAPPALFSPNAHCARNLGTPIALAASA